ncbi:glycosyltransferase family 39 protein [Runella slithyformis]|uniref:Glycosyl transferase family 39 n=1 Tax=Runella slithyformis (strain ATCC 29530 / DSM 19594 / LMG 11500 / NCIMB 11436 / LSU 4) TaxID=761193 RepID=A0A7U3ZN81_RUNSL|nr:glycosyltransferase family 39 protein [Runella slithyformis]AEI50325.1 glycosyl transferase family 39 [Runella slithyformis DSM 19594]
MPLSQTTFTYQNKHVYYWLIAILILAASLRLYRLDAHGIFFDEKATMMVSQGMVQNGGNQHDVFNPQKYVFTNQEFWQPQTFSEYLEAMRRSDIGNSPFYYAILHSWVSITGISDFTARLLSVLFSVLTVWLIFIFVNHFLQSSRLALTAAALAAIEPFFVAYSQQARNYSLTFFLTLSATYCFLRALEADNKRQPSLRWFLFYGLVAGLSILSHFLAATVCLAHGIYALVTVRSLRTWAALIGAGALAVSGLATWIIWGGGDWTLRSLNHQQAVYLECAFKRPYNNPYGIILPATFKNVFDKSLPIFTDLWIYSNGLIGTLEGRKNAIMAILIGLGLIFAFRFSQKNREKSILISAITAITMGSSAFFYSNHKIGFSIASVAILMFFLAFNQTTFKNKNLIWFLIITAIIPSAFLIFNAARSGHTYGLTQRYSGFSFPYVIILASIALWQLIQSKGIFKYLVINILLLQSALITRTLRSIYDDMSLKYNYRIDPRLPNPHFAAAQKAREIYEKGDTLLIGAPRNVYDNPMDGAFMDHSVTDAQYFNLYLPKDGIFVQRLDTINVDKISLKKASGQLIELTDLKGKRY